MTNWKLVEKWRDALRSGKYKQGKDYLRNAANHFCCLGVLCYDTFKMTGEIKKQRYSFDGNDIVLPKSVFEKMGFEGNTPNLFGYSLEILNDAKNASFDEIADLLDIAILMHKEGVPDNEIFTSWSNTYADY